MLVLTRKIGDTLVLGNDLQVKLLRIKGKSRVRLGIESARPVPCPRGDRAVEHAALPASAFGGEAG
jgi:carbon storage regulator CsrA